MEILINELSLNEQFLNFEDFKESLIETLRIIKSLRKHEIVLLKKYDFYSAKVSPDLTLYDILKSNDDAVVRYKNLLADTLKQGFWEEDQKHSNDDLYTLSACSSNINGTSIAESFERDGIILSFLRSHFSHGKITVSKNEFAKEIINFYEHKKTLKHLMDLNLLAPLDFCKEYFKNTNLDFSLLEAGVGFDSLEHQHHPTFIKAFEEFSGMDWHSIMQSDGLKYKQYSPSSNEHNAFASPCYNGLNIYKFRVTQLMRCFGYRKGDIFFVLRFEFDHSISDHG